MRTFSTILALCLHRSSDFLITSRSLQVRQYLFNLGISGTESAAAQVSPKIDESTNTAETWFIIKRDVGRCGEGIQVWQPFSRMKPRENSADCRSE
jgi:hypothetical protein